MADEGTAGSVLVEAGRLAFDARFDRPDHDGWDGDGRNAVERGWRPLDLPGLIPGGVQTVTTAGLPPVPLPVPELSSALHAYTGELEGRTTLALAFRGTDEGPAEFLFQATPLPGSPNGWDYGWDVYADLHMDAVRGALDHAADPANGIERVLITGESLGGVLAELATARVLVPEHDELLDRSITVTMGSPGSTETVPDAANILHILHTDDLVVRLPELTARFRDTGAAREGREIWIERPEGSLEALDDVRLDSLRDLLDALGDRTLVIEHELALYQDSIAVLDRADPFLPDTAERQDEPFRWLDAEPGRIVLGSTEGGTVKGTGAADIILAGPEDELILARRGDDVVLVREGRVAVDGGRGTDTLIVEGESRDYELAPLGRGESGLPKRFDSVLRAVEDSGRELEVALARVERIAFADLVLDLATGETAAPPPRQPLDDLVASGEPVTG